MSIFKKIKSVFIVDDNSNPATEEKIALETNLVTEVNTEKQEGSTKYYELLTQILEKNNFSGYDYLEFRKALQSVTKLATLDEPNVYKTVYAAAQAMNVDAKLLIKTANDYLNLLEHEKLKFQQAADNFLSQQAQTKKSEIETLEQSLVEDKQSMEDLKLKISKDESRLESIKSELSGLQTKVQSNKSEFDNNYSVFTEEIKQDIQKMEKYLS